LAATGQPTKHEPFQPMPEGFKHVAWGDVDAIAKAVDASVAAVLIEPVQGEGGIRPASPEFLKGLEALCRERGALLVFDEIQCGLGRTGKMFAFQHSGVVPDMLTLAKPLGGGLPMGALLLKESLAPALKVGDHGTTFGGNPVCAAAALAVLDHLEAPGFLDDVAARGLYLLRGLKKLARKHKDEVADVRGLGLMIGVELVQDRQTRRPAPELRERVLTEAFRRGLLLLGCGKSAVRLAPPLTIDEEDAEIAAAILDEAIAAASA
jgi:acetylornithine/succinyldiaminopimelate/putrescine aminotransferase